MQQRFRWALLIVVGLPVLFTCLAAPVVLAQPGSDHLTYLEYGSHLLDDLGGVEGLNGANSAVVSPDGRFTYVVSSRDNALIQYQRNPANGLLTQQSIRRAGLGEDGTLDGIFLLEFGPGGEQLYALTAGSRLLVFQRDSVSGDLTLTQTLVDQENEVQGIGSPIDMAVSADGRHVYVISGFSGILVTFQRDPSDGHLTFLSLAFDPFDVPGSEFPENILNRPSRIIASADSRFLYLASFLGGVTTFERNAQTGELQVLQNLEFFDDDIGLPFDLEFSPGEEHAYVVDLSGQFEEDPSDPPGIRILERNSETGLLTRIGECCVEATGPPLFQSGASLQFHPDGEQVYVVGFHESRVSRFDRDPGTGLLEWAGEISEFSPGAPKLLGITRFGMDPSGSSLYVPSNIDDSLTVITTSPPNGPMAVVQQWIDGEGAQVTGLDRPRDLSVSVDGRFVYSSSFWDDAISVQEVSPDGRSLTQVQIIDPNDSETLSNLGWMTISPDSRFLYLRRNGVTIYSRDESSGLLSFQEEAGGERLHRSMGISPQGDRAYAGVNEGQGPGLRSYARDTSTGALTQIDSFIEYDSGNDFPGYFDRIEEIVVSPDGRHIYLIDPRHPLVVFARPEEGDRPVFVQEVPFDVVPRQFGMSTPRAFAFDPLGQYLYVVADRGGVIVFERDESTGRLTYQEHLEDEPDVNFPSFRPTAVAVSPDGFHVYVTDTWEDSLNVFVRNPVNGRLKLLEKRRNGFGGVDGLLNPEAFALSADGERVFVGTEVGGILSFTKRDLVCEPGEEKLCLNQGRFHVEMDWLTQRGNMGPGKS
nr:beta-propeller fold lactonase family protein [Deltaproteobacteria bacterium]